MLLSAAEVRSGYIPGPRIPPFPLDPRTTNLRRLNHWRRFQLGDIETVTVTPEVTIPSDLLAPPLPTFIAPAAPDVLPPPIDIVQPAQPSPPVSTSTVSTDWFGDLTKLAQIAGSTTVGVIAAEHGISPLGLGVPGVTAGPGIAPGMTAAQLSALTPAQRAQYAAMYPGASAQPDLLSSLFGGSSMTTILLVSGLSLVAVLMLAKKR